MEERINNVYELKRFIQESLIIHLRGCKPDAPYKLMPGFIPD